MKLDSIMGSEKKSDIESFQDRLINNLNLKDLFLSVKDNVITLHSIMIDKKNRNRGIGTLAMLELIKYADNHGMIIVLTPDQKNNIRGTTSRNRLVNFYKRFGFLENKGQKTDYSIGSGKMYRLPQPT